MSMRAVLVSDWGHTGIRLGLPWDQTGSIMGPNWGEYRNQTAAALGPYWEALTGSYWGDGAYWEQKGTVLGRTGLHWDETGVTPSHPGRGAAPERRWQGFSERHCQLQCQGKGKKKKVLGYLFVF